MTDELYLKVNHIKEMLDSDPRVVRLNELEIQMDNDKEVMALAYRKDSKAVAYSDALNHFGEESEMTQKTLKELHQAKLDLDSHPLVKEYLAAYKEVRELYDAINEILFGNFSANLCPKGEK